MPQIAYSAPAACPTAGEFERRLRVRLSKPAAAWPLGFSIRLTVHEARIRGELQVRGAAEARRVVEAASCDEAVDALTLIAALLIEPAQAAAPAAGEPSSRRPQPASRASSRREVPNANGASEPPAPRRRATSERATPQRASPSGQPPPSRQPARSRGAEGLPQPDAQAAPAGPQQPDDPPPAVSPPQPAGAQQPDEQPMRSPASRGQLEEPAEARPPTLAAKQPTQGGEAPTPPAPAGRQHTTARLASSFELAAAALLAHGTLPALRPGLSLRGSLALARPGHPLGVALELGARGLLPHLERSREGDAHFRFYAGAAAVCATYRGAERARGVLSGSACALAELGRIVAEGRATERPRQANVRFAALGPALRASLALTTRSSLFLGTELLFPLARDRFELAGTRLFRVPPLTIRLELGVAVRFE